jgi:hypothetical protein
MVTQSLVFHGPALEKPGLTTEGCNFLATCDLRTFSGRCQGTGVPYGRRVLRGSKAAPLESSKGLSRKDLGSDQSSKSKPLPAV